MPAQPSPRVVAALEAARDREQLAAASGDYQGAAIARAEYRAIVRRITRSTHR